MKTKIETKTGRTSVQSQYGTNIVKFLSYLSEWPGFEHLKKETTKNFIEFYVMLQMNVTNIAIRKIWLRLEKDKDDSELLDRIFGDMNKNLLNIVTELINDKK
jgi:hypothetical protein